MSGPSPSTSHRQSTKRRIGQGEKSRKSRRQSPRKSIHILDDDSLIHVFYLYQPFILGEDQDFNARLSGGDGKWVRGRWWYKLAHVCQRLRNVILGSASHLGISLVCTYGTPVADMLAHSPPLPLVVDFFRRGRHITTDDEEGIILALKQHNRVLRVRLGSLVSPQKFVAAMDEEYPILEYLVIEHSFIDDSTILIYPKTLQAPHLRHLRLQGFALPIGSRLFTAAVGLVTLSLVMLHPSTYFHPNTLLQWISLMPQLETLTIYFKFSTPSRDVKGPIIAPLILPNLRHFHFRCVNTYPEALLHRMATPRLNLLEIEFFNQLSFPSHVSCSLLTQQRISGSAGPSSLSPRRNLMRRSILMGRPSCIPLALSSNAGTSTGRSLP